jgi:hypothetical protein
MPISKQTNKLIIIIIILEDYRLIVERRFAYSYAGGSVNSW